MMRLRPRICEDEDRRGLNPLWFDRKIVSGIVRPPFLGIGTMPEIPHSGGIFLKYVLLQNFSKSFLNLGSRHTSMGMLFSPGTLPSFICLIAM